MKKLSLVLACFLLTLGYAIAQRTITGTITDDNGDALIGASVLVKGTSIGTTTEVDGTFSLSVPAGGTTLVITYTGFETQEVELGASDVVNITMREGLQLQEVVVTGLGIKREKKALGYGVSTISNQGIQARPETDVSRLLRGRATGVDITQTSGLSGSGTNVIIRGYSSITGSNQPLFVVDGIPFNSNTNADRGFDGGGATASSRFLDLDPNNIKEVSILKGLSATVLYGEAGRNGVILITTKTGDVDGGAENKKMEVSVNQSVGITQIANLPEYQDTYGNGFAGAFGWFFSNWGPAFTTRGKQGISAEGTIPHPLDQVQYNDDFPELKGARYEYKPYKSLENFFQNGVISNTSVNMDKSFKGGALSATYSYLSDDGFVPDSKNLIKKHNFGLGGRMELLNGLELKGSFNFVNTDRTTPPSAPSFGSGAGGNPSLFGDLLYTPRSVDLLGIPYQSPLDGSQAYYRRGSAIQNPLWTLNNASDNEAIDRFFTTLSLTYKLTNWLTASYRYGLDTYTQQNVRAINRGGSQLPDGALGTIDYKNRIDDQLLSLSYDFSLGENFSLDGLVGANVRNDKYKETGLISTNQFVFGLLRHNNFINHNSYSFVTNENQLGLIGTATLGYKNYLYLNLQGRNDWTSTLEKANHSVFYPSASVSFVPTDAFAGLQNNKWLNYLKLRLGYGTSAGYPDPYQTRNVLSTATNRWVTPGGSILNINAVSNRLGNSNLAPELHKELEFGLETRFLNNIFGIDLSLYNKKSSDLIIDLDLDPATGYRNTTVNAAEVTNKGIELGINVSPFRKNFQWDMTLNFTRNRNIVDAVAPGVESVIIAGYSNLGNFAIPGEPFGVIRGTGFERDNAGKLVITADGRPIATDVKSIGDPNPNYTASLLNRFSFKGLTFDFQWNYVDGGDIISYLTATMMARGNTKDTDVDRYIPVYLPGVTEDGAVNLKQDYLGDVMFNYFFWSDEGTLFDATVIRLREVGLSYQFPKKLLNKTPFGSALIRFAGENLWFNAPNFPKFINYDPEVLSTGVGNGRGFEYITGPTSRKYGVSLNFSF